VHALFVGACGGDQLGRWLGVEHAINIVAVEHHMEALFWDHHLNAAAQFH
jgi:hypothetical protein